MYRYKLRAECHDDVVNLMKSMGENYSFVMLNLLDKSVSKSDEEFTFDSNLTPVEIKEKLLSIPDSHVMYETLDFSESYTGERRYDFPK